MMASCLIVMYCSESLAWQWPCIFGCLASASLFRLQGISLLALAAWHWSHNLSLMCFIMQYCPSCIDIDVLLHDRLPYHCSWHLFLTIDLDIGTMTTSLAGSWPPWLQSYDTSLEHLFVSASLGIGLRALALLLGCTVLVFCHWNWPWFCDTHTALATMLWPHVSAVQPCFFSIGISVGPVASASWCQPHVLAVWHQTIRVVLGLDSKSAWYHPQSFGLPTLPSSIGSLAPVFWRWHWPNISIVWGRALFGDLRGGLTVPAP